MASKVNTKFVIILSASVIVIAGAVAAIGYNTISKSAADHLKVAAEAENKGDLEAAASAYAKAVNKARGNPDYISKWLAALGKLTPTPSTAYRERFRNEYLLALRALANNLPSDAGVQNRQLELILTELRLVPPAASGWEGLYTTAETAINNFPAGEKSVDLVKRYRGIARVTLMQLVADQPDDKIAEAKADLLAALASNPDDAEAASFLAEWHRQASDRARRKGEEQDAEKVLAEGRKVLEDFVAQRPVWSPVGLALARFDFSEDVRKADLNARSGDIIVAQHPRILKVIDQFLKEPADKVDRQTAISLAEFTVGMGVPKREELAVRVLEHRLEGAPQDVVTLFKVGEIELATGQFEKAIERLGQLVTMKDLPLSQDGMMLFGLREEAVARQTEAALAVWQTAPAEPAADKAKWLDQARAFRAKYTEMAGSTTPRGMSLEGKIKYAEGDFIESRRLLAQYLDQTGRSDLAALKLLGDILRRQANPGGARQQYTRAIELNARDIESLGALAEIEIGLQDYVKAQKHVDSILQLDPSNTRAAEALAKLRDVIRGTEANDPFTRMMAQVQQKLNASPQDAPGALKLLRDAADTMTDLGLPEALALANRLVLVNDAAKAKEVLDKAQAKSPDDKRIKDALASLENKDPVKRQLDGIEAAALPDVIKSMLRYQLYTRLSRPDDAAAELAKAKAIEPEHALVVSAEFDAALNAKKFPEAMRLSDLAVSKNLDRVQGLIFRVRLEQAQGRLAEAEQLAQQAVDVDALNPVCWRLLGVVRFQRGKFAEASTAFERGLQLKPDDVELIKGNIRSKISAQQVNEALIMARQNLQFASGDAEFASLWLTLEGSVGDKARATEMRQRQFARDPKDCENATELANLLVQDNKFPEARRAIDAVKANCPAEQSRNNIVLLEASWFANQRDVLGAKKVWEDFIASQPESKRDSAMYIAYAQFMSRMGQNRSALEILQSARGKQDKQVCEIDREIGDLYFAANDFKAAIPEYERVSKECKDDDNKVKMRLVEAYLRSNEFQKADEVGAALDKSGGIKGDDQHTLLLLRADAALGVGDRPRAKDFFDRAIAAKPQSALGFVKRAEFLLGDKDLVRDGITDLERALQLDPRFALARTRLASYYASTEEPARAVDLLREGLGLTSDDSGIRIELVRQLNRMGQPAEALSTVKDAMAKSPDPQWRVMAGELLAQAAQHRDAIELFTEAWKNLRSPGLARLYCESLLALPTPDVAKVKEILAEPSIGTDRIAPLLMLRARVAAAEGRGADVKADVQVAFAGLEQASLSEATQFFSDLRRAVPNASELLSIIEPLKPTDGQFPEATLIQLARVRLADPALRAEGLKIIDAMYAAPKDKATVMMGVRVTADGLYSEKQYEAAADLYARLLKQLPDDANLMNNLAYTLSKHLERHQEALPLAEQAASAQPNNSNVLDTLGTVQLALGQLDKAEQTLERGREVAMTPQQQLPLVLHLTEVALAKGNRAKADTLIVQVDRILGRDPRIRVQFEAEIARVQKKMRGGN